MAIVGNDILRAIEATRRIEQWTLAEQGVAAQLQTILSTTPYLSGDRAREIIELLLHATRGGVISEGFYRDAVMAVASAVPIIGIVVAAGPMPGGPIPRHERTFPNHNDSPCILCAIGVRPDDSVTTHIIDGQKLIVSSVGGYVTVFTADHNPSGAIPNVWPDQMRVAAREWAREKTGFSEEMIGEIQLGDTRLSEEEWPWVQYPLGFDEQRTFPRITAHPFVGVNVHELIHHRSLPVYVADRLIVTAQRYVGYFYGEHVRAGQMANLAITDEHGRRDVSVHRTGEVWIEPFEPGDSCVFCQRTTDESIQRRVEEFDKEIEKEVKNAEGLLPFKLTALPKGLQRALVIQWNHVYRDWLRDDPRYCFKDGRYYAIIMPKPKSLGIEKSIRLSAVQAEFIPETVGGSVIGT